MSQKLWVLISMLLLSQAPSAGAKGLFDLNGMNEAKEAALVCEKHGKWKQIAWRPTMQQALADAAKTQKPIMVALVVGKKGEQNAKEC
jgi:hypothetical protein